MAKKSAENSKIRGGEIVARMLQAEGVDKVFGIIDGTYFGFYSNLEKYGIELITPRHESCAVHMAGAYARATGKLGVCMASNGPGVANALPGIAVENGEGNRVLLITSCRREGIGYPDRGGTYQYFNQVGVTKPMTKWSAAVPSRGRIQEMMQRAFRISFRGRPGVVHVDIPESVLNTPAEFDWKLLQPPTRYRRTESIAPDDALVEQAARMLAEATLPMIHAGSGVVHAGAYEELQMVAELLRAPVTTSWAARGVLSEDSDCAVPMIHVELNNVVRREADVVLTLGSRLGETDWWGKPPYWRSPRAQKMIQVDNDEELLGLNKPVDLAILADAKVFLRRLFEALRKVKGEIGIEPRNAALERYRIAASEDRAKLDEALKHSGAPMHPSHAAHVCQQVLPRDTTWVFDGGNTTIWANFYHRATVPNTIFSTFKFGMLGAGVSQAVGAKVARPDSTVCCIIGDGAMGFHPQEIETAVRNDLPVIYVVLCDRQWGMVKMNQQFMLKPMKTLLLKSLRPDETIKADLGEIKFHALARSMGADGYRASTPDELRDALRKCATSGRTAVIHVDVDPVAHMWAPALKVFKDMHAEPAGE